MLKNILYLLIASFSLSLFAYIASIVKEKNYLKKKIIMLNSNKLSDEIIEQIDVCEFHIFGKYIRAGDEVKLFLTDRDKFKGLIIGGNQGRKSIIIMTNRNDIREILMREIKNFKIISKYGKFFR